MDSNQTRRRYALRDISRGINVPSAGKRRHLENEQQDNGSHVKKHRQPGLKASEQQYKQQPTEDKKICVAAQTDDVGFHKESSDNSSAFSNDYKKKDKVRKATPVLAPTVTSSVPFLKEDYLQKFGPAFEKIRATYHLDRQSFTRIVEEHGAVWEEVNRKWHAERGAMPCLIMVNLNQECPNEIPKFEYIQKLVYSEQADRILLKLTKNTSKCRCSCANPTGCNDCNYQKKTATSACRFLHYHAENGVLKTKKIALMTGDHLARTNFLWTLHCNPAVCKDPKNPCVHDLEKFKRYPLIVTREPGVLGWGLRAAENMPVGSFVTEYTGEVRLKNEESTYENSHAFKERDFILDALKKGNEGRLLSHSCDPNCLVVHLCHESRALFKTFSRKLIIVRREVEAGEPLTIDYHAGLEGVKTMEKPKGSITCLCGSQNCRGWLQEPTSKSSKKSDSVL